MSAPHDPRGETAPTTTTETKAQTQSGATELTGAPGGHRLPELVAIMDRLLAPDGCPWDREQTLATLRPFLVEETYEVLDAIEHGSAAEHCEELGDLMMQIVFQSALRRAEGAFDIDDVVAAISEKLIRRHPHVFADASAETSEQVLAQWEEIKDAEKRQKAERDGERRHLDRVARALPPLLRAHKLTQAAARVGFDWPDNTACEAKIREELDELAAARAAGDADQIRAEVGDLLLSVVNLARRLGCDPDTALREANNRFYSRFCYIEEALEARGSSLHTASLEAMDALWERAKARDAAGSTHGGTKQPDGDAGRPAGDAEHPDP